MSGPARATPHASSKATVLDVIRAAGVISRVGLIGATGFTGATISTVVRKLIDEGLVVETGRAESTGGKRRVLLQLNHSARYAVGVHLDHAGNTYVLTNLGGAVVARILRPGVADPAAVVGQVADSVSALVEGVGIERELVLGVGVVSPGAPGAPGADVEGLVGELGRAVGLPVAVDNDATAAALGEHWSGGIGGTATSAALCMGTRLGAGLVIGGITYRGNGGDAGEIGHVSVDALGPVCWCGGRGCLEVMAGPAAVVAEAGELPSLARELKGGSVAADFAAVARAARRGEGAALGLLERSARCVAVAARSLANLMDLEVLVLTGPGFAVAGSVYLPVIREELGRAVVGRGSGGVDVRLSRSASTAPAIGAAALVLQAELVPLTQGLRLPENLAAAEPAALAPGV
ncbi:MULTISPECIES: ROK family transcriptional regulator [Actinosynnema]|uniref:ROK family transcriptional regulator n=1 Tax=Actinosynnema TaxID=40566 RepID=UPI0020A5678D|nr:ROK family transcriptional regulator [Actinosynnema pretiosum]MCP2098024.1 Sugar kinase of the NBD/HSP70 family, may containing an N-terminal HTH domain [Actinosynnema pretiosum]